MAGFSVRDNSLVKPGSTGGTLSAEPLVPRVADPGSTTPTPSTSRCGKYSILAVLAPVMTLRGSEVSYPGDPMCLYYALSLTTQRQRTDGHGALPDWGRPPSRALRDRLGCDPVAPGVKTPFNRVFDPRVWDGATARIFESRLRQSRPEVIVISAVSAGLRIATEMARIVRLELPDALIILGGRHVDDTMRARRDGSIELDYSNPCSHIISGRLPAVFDFVIAGQGAALLDALLVAIGEVPAQLGRLERIECSVRCLRQRAARSKVDGRTLLAAANRTRGFDGYVHDGRHLSVTDLPSPYAAFPIRARFPVFADHRGEVPLTAHAITHDRCVFRCSFCSEAARPGTPTLKPRGDAVEFAITMVEQLVSYGAGAIFFDDPVLFGGSWSNIEAFAVRLDKIRASPEPGPPAGTASRRGQLVWGGQFTADLVVADPQRSTRVLRLARRAGMRYAYLGIESLSQTVMDSVEKNLRRGHDRWMDKVVDALTIFAGARIPVGCSVLFGLDNESRHTVMETIEGIAHLLDSGLLTLASPNLATYHPNTAFARRHVGDKLDYHSTSQNRYPYTLFEEAHPSAVSKQLNEDLIQYIHTQCDAAWGQGRNRASVT